MPSGAAVRTSEDFQEVAVGILKIDSASAVVVVDFARLCLCGIGPVGKSSLLNSSENFVKFRLTNKKRVVLLLYLAVCIHEIDVGTIVSRDHLERSESLWSRQAQNLRQKLRRCAAIADPNNGVIELDSHANLPDGYALASSKLACAFLARTINSLIRASCDPCTTPAAKLMRRSLVTEEIGFCWPRPNIKCSRAFMSFNPPSAVCSSFKAPIIDFRRRAFVFSGKTSLKNSLA